MGASTTIQTEGELFLADWSDVAGTEFLTPGETYYLHTDGQIRVTPPSTGFATIVGRAITTTRLDCEIQIPIAL